MAQNILTYRYNNGLGIRTGFTDNQGYNISITPIVATSGEGTSSMAGTFSINAGNTTYTWANLTGPLTGTSNIVINATASQIYDQMKIMVQGAASGTTSVVLSGDAASEGSLTTSLTATKYLVYDGIFNGKVFVFNTYQTV